MSSLTTVLSIVAGGFVGLAAAAPLVAQTLRGSQSSVDLMYAAAHTDDLTFLQTRADLYSAAASGALEPISITDDLTLKGVRYPFVLPNTRRFADSLAAKYHAACGQRLEVTSGSRPVDEQPRNASPKSVHPTGMAIDFHRPSGACLPWLRTSLLALEKQHVIEATEEKRPPHFHVAVLRQLREPPTNARAAATPAATPIYRVRAGDNLSTIAARHHTTVKALTTLNGLTSSRVKVGQKLRLP